MQKLNKLPDNDRPRISVDMGCYNFEDFIAEAIESVLGQTLPPWEIIISDDCSADKSWEIIQSYARKYPDLIRAFRNAENLGMKKCGVLRKNMVRGELLSSIDGDDRWLPRKLELEWQSIIESPDARIAYSNVYLIDASGKRIGIWYDGEGESPPSGDVFIHTFAKRFFKNNRSVFRNQLMYYDILREVGYEDFNDQLIHTDWDRKIRLTSKYKVAYSGHALVEYRVHDQGIHRKMAGQIYDSTEYVVKKNLHLLDSRSPEEKQYVIENLKSLLLHDYNYSAQNKPLRTSSGPIHEMKASKGYLGDDLIFLISQPRAGSTLLQRLLAGNPEIHTVSEPWIMLHPLYALKKKGLVSEYDATLANQALEDFLSQFPEGEAVYIDAVRRMAESLYRRSLEVAGKKLFLDKTPRYFHIIPELYRLFPKAKYIFLIRNPMATLSSALMSWFKNDIQHFTRSPNYIDALRGPQLLIDGMKQLGENYVAVHYEDLVRNPSDVCSKVCDWVGVEFEEDMLFYGRNNPLEGRFGDSTGIVKHDHAVSDYLDKWVGNLSSPLLIEFANEYLSTLGQGTFSQLGYSFKETRQKLNAIKGYPTTKTVGSTHANNNPKMITEKGPNLDRACEAGHHISKKNNNSVQVSQRKILVSAIVSAYNSEKFLRGCLEDLESQTIAAEMEIIVVDSGSEQNEGEIVKEYQNKYANIKYIRTEYRENVYAAWNRGIRAASGKYITNANTDDRHRQDAFEIMVRALEEHPEAGAVYTDTLITDNENETFEKNTSGQVFHRPNFNLRQMLLFSFFGPQPMWRRSVHQKIGYFDASLSVAADYDFFIRLARECRALRIDAILGLYTRRNDSIENSNRRQCVSETLQVLRRYRSIIPLEEMYPDLNSKPLENALGACLADQGNCCLFGDLPDIEGALGCYNRALEHGYAEPELAANLGVALCLGGNPTQGMEVLRRVADRVQPAARNLAFLKQCITEGKQPPIGQLEAVEIRHPVVSASTRAKGVTIEDNRFVPVETVEKHWTGSGMVRELAPKTGRRVTGGSRPALVSVILRTMNRPIFLDECLASLAAQTFRDFEVVVVNDGGVNIDDVIEKYTNRMEIVYRQHPSNKGRSAALNTGLSSARGKYITYLDDDDRIYPDHFETLVQELERGDFSVVYGDSFEAGQEAVDGGYATVGKRLVYSIDFDRGLLSRTNYIPILNLMQRRDCVEKVGLFDENLPVLEDWDYWIRLSEHYDFKHIPRVTAEYRVRSDHSNATAAEGHQFPACRQRIRAKLTGSAKIPATLPQTPLVSMVILTCNQLEYTRKCLASISKHTQPPFEIIVVDNGSADGTLEYLDSMMEENLFTDRLTVIRNRENRGFAAGNNQGIAAAKGEYILLMNNDIVVTPGWVDRLIACAQKNPGAGMVGPVSNYVSGPQQVKDVGYNTETLEGLNRYSAQMAEQHSGRARRLLRVVGFCMLIKRAVIEKIGGLDHRYGLGNFEDDDFSLRAALAGFESWMAEDCFVHHFGSRTFIGEKIDYRKSLEVNWGLFKKKWGLPEDMPYGAGYSLNRMAVRTFDPEKHYVPPGDPHLAVGLPGEKMESPRAQLYTAVQNLIGEGKSEAAVEKLKELVDSDPEFAPAHNDLGVLYHRAGDRRKSLDHYRNAARLQPDSITYLKNLADLLCVEFGRIEEALQLYVKVLQIDPEDQETLINTGHVCKALDRFQDAEHFYRRVLEIDPRHPDALKYLEALSRNQVQTVSAVEQPHIGEKCIESDTGPAASADEPTTAGFHGDPGLVSILVPLDGSPKRLKDGFNSLVENRRLPFEVVLLDKGAAKGLKHWARQQAQKHHDCKSVTLDPQSAPADLLNRGIAEASGEFIVWLHADAKLPENWLADMQAVFAPGTDVGVVGPMADHARVVQQVATAPGDGAEEFADFTTRFRERYRHRRIPVNGLDGFCIMFKKELLDRIGEFDRNFRSEAMLVEDFCFRSRLMGNRNLVAGDVFVLRSGRGYGGVGAKHRAEVETTDRRIFREKWNNFDAGSPVAKAMETHQTIEAAHAWFEKGRPEEGIETYLQGIGANPRERRLYLRLAKDLINFGRYREALESLDEMPPQDPVAPDGDGKLPSVQLEMITAVLLRGYAQEGLENYDRAAEYAAEVLGIEPGWAPALNLQGVLKYRTGDLAAAESLFRQAVQSDPGCAEAYSNLGAVLWETDRKEASFELFQKGFGLEPTDADIAAIYHHAVADAACYAEAEPVVRDAAAIHPGNQKIRYMLIDILIQQEKFAAAMPEIEAAISLFGIEDGILAAALQVRKKLGHHDNPGRRGGKVSLCMIVKNEEEFLAGCLQSVKPIVDEMIVVNTGSSDRTADIAAAFGAKVFDFEWRNDFAAARNVSLENATGDWVLVMDADEVISPQDYEAFRKIVSKRPRAPIAYSIVTRNYTALANNVGWMPNDGKYAPEEAGIGWMPSQKVRLFFGRERIRFEGAVHEMVDPVLVREKIDIRKCSIPIHHYGRLDRGKLEEKGEVYYRIGRRKLEETGDEIGPLRELAVQATNMGKNDEAIELWHRLLALDLHPALAAEAHVNMATAYSRLGRFGDALQSSQTAVRLRPRLKEARYNLAMAELHLGNARESTAILESLVEDHPDYPPAHFVLTAAYACVGQEQQFIRSIRKLKASGIGKGLVYAFVELVRCLLEARQVEYAMVLASASIENGIVNETLMEMLSCCLKLKQDVSRSSMVGGVSNQTAENGCMA